MPNRIIKESICTSDTIDKLNADEERFFYRLIVQADDFGRFDGRAPVVLAGTFPLRAHEIAIDQVEAWLQRLADVDLIRFYHVDGRRYLYFTTWDKHQQKRAKYSKFPDPPADDGDVKSDDINGNQTQSSDAICPRETRIRECENTRQTDETHAPPRDTAPLPDSFVGQSVGPVDDDLPDPHDGMTLQDVSHRYQQRIGIVGSGVLDQMNAWHEDHDVSFGVIALAIDETAEARGENRIRKGVDSYLWGVVRGKFNDGVRTVEDWRAKERADPRAGKNFDTEASIQRALARLDTLDKAAGEG